MLINIFIIGTFLFSCGGGSNNVGDSNNGSTVSINPTYKEVELGEQVMFTATVNGGSGNITWLIQGNDPDKGNVNQNGVYTAPDVPGTYTIVATSTQDPNEKATATVKVKVGTKWLTYINYFRRITKDNTGNSLSSVNEDPNLSDGAKKHAKYLVKNDTSHPTIDPGGNPHDEDPNNQWYTQEGQKAAQNGNVVKSETYYPDANDGNQTGIESWMTGPFHALWIIDPALENVGYGNYSENDGTGWQWAAVLDVIQGRSSVPTSTIYPLVYPVMFPGNDTTIRLYKYDGLENPDPLASCPFNATPQNPSGLPIIIQLGNDPSKTYTPSITAVSLKKGNTDIEHCWFDETSYTNPDSSAQDKVRGILNSHDAVIIIPKNPLEAGATYTVSVTADGIPYQWSFTVSDFAGN